MRSTLRNLFTLYSKWDVCGEAVDGQQAIDAAVALKPDLVLLDYKMPNADGIEAASEIKQNCRKPQSSSSHSTKRMNWSRRRAKQASEQSSEKKKAS